MKLLIIGNAGCGKTYLSKKLAKQQKIPIYHIDHIWFKPGGYSAEFERTPAERKTMITKIMAQKKLYHRRCVRDNSKTVCESRITPNIYWLSGKSMY
jgi:adenylate kinase family enzyme